MSVSVVYVCDECGDDEHEDIEFGDYLPFEWHVDPEDDERHLCEHCWEERYPPFPDWGHPDPARALPFKSGWCDRPCCSGAVKAVRAYSGELCPCGVVHGAPSCE